MWSARALVGGAFGRVYGTRSISTVTAIVPRQIDTSRRRELARLFKFLADQQTGDDNDRKGVIIQVKRRDVQECTGRRIADKANLHHLRQIARPFQVRISARQLVGSGTGQISRETDQKEKDKPDIAVFAQYFEIDAVRRPVDRGIRVVDGPQFQI